MKMYYLTDFKYLVSIFSLIFNPIDPFSLILDLVDPHFRKTYFFLRMLNPVTKHLVKYPPPWVRRYWPHTTSEQSHISLLGYRSRQHMPSQNYTTMKPLINLLDCIQVSSDQWCLSWLYSISTRNWTTFQELYYTWSLKIGIPPLHRSIHPCIHYTQLYN